MSTLELPGALPQHDVIDVWQLAPDLVLAGGELDHFLSEEERARAGRFLFPRDAARYRVCHAALRLLLGSYLGVPAKALRLAAGARGKPFIAGETRLRFNLSHCEGLALIAVTAVREVGIDVEALDRDVEALEIATDHFTRRETETIAAAGDAREQARQFLRLWTRKEAVLKAAGCGIEQGLNAFDVALDDENVARLSGVPGAGEETSWMVRDINGIPGFAAALAAPLGAWTMHKREIVDHESFQCLIAANANTIGDSRGRTEEG